MNIQISKADESKLLAKMNLEYSASDNYTKDWKLEVANVKTDYLTPSPEQDKVKVKKVLNLMKMKRSVFKTDDETVTNVPQNGQNGQEVANNTDLVFKAFFKTAGLRIKKGKAQDDDTLYGVGCIAVDGWDNYLQQPKVSYVDSRLTFPDPSNSEGNAMRFFGTLLKKTIYELEGDDAFDNERVQKVRLERNKELEQVSRDNGNTEGDVGDDLVSIYNHITIFKEDGSNEYYKCLTTWNASRTILLRYVKMQPLSESEKADPSTITLGVTLYRGIPIPGQYNGASAIDEVGPYQDLENLITNLQIQQTLRNVVGGKTILDGELGVDEEDYANMEPGEVIIANRKVGSQTNIQNGVFKEPPEQTSPIIGDTLNRLDRLAQEATLQNSLAQGQSLGGAQTKAEVQLIQQNTNQILSGIASEYMESSVNMWTDIYRGFVANMSSQRVKNITIVGTNKVSESYGFKKKDFITKGDLYITIESKAQESIKNKKDFAILLSLDTSMAGILQPGSVPFSKWKRTLLDKSGITGINGTDYVPYTQDERVAYSNLLMLNQDIKIEAKPEPGEDHDTFIQIYKNGVPTDARDKAIADRERILEATPKELPPTEQPTGAGGGGLGASMIASTNAEQQGETSLSDIAV